MTKINNFKFYGYAFEDEYYKIYINLYKYYLKDLTFFMRVLTNWL